MLRFIAHRFIGVLCGLLVALIAGAQEAPRMLIESVDGPVTQKEIDSFKQFMSQVPLPVSNKGNGMVYGSAGGAVEALGDVYQINKDRPVLDRMLQFTDAMLSGRNDPQTGRIIWTGKRELCWPNKVAGTPGDTYSGTENGDVLAHIAYAAQLILLDKSLWDQKVSEDAHGYGATYLDRAKTYVREADRTIDTFLLPHFVDEKGHRYHFPTAKEYGTIDERADRSRGKPVPWNQQAMLNGGFQRLAMCHELLGDDVDRVKRYDTIVRASMDWFFSEMTRYQVDGHDCYKWGYGPENPLRHVEDAGHGGYDILGAYRAYTSGRYGVTKEMMLPLANTVQYVIYKGPGQFATRVDGQGETRDSVGGTYLYLCEISPPLDPILAPAIANRATTRPESAARLLWLKHLRSVTSLDHPS